MCSQKELKICLIDDFQVESDFLMSQAVGVNVSTVIISHRVQTCQKQKRKRVNGKLLEYKSVGVDVSKKISSNCQLLLSSSVDIDLVRSVVMTTRRHRGSLCRCKHVYLLAHRIHELYVCIHMYT